MGRGGNVKELSVRALKVYDIIVTKYTDGVGFNDLADDEDVKKLMSPHTLRKVLKELEKAGVIIVQRGKRGQKYLIQATYSKVINEFTALIGFRLDYAKNKLREIIITCQKLIIETPSNQREKCVDECAKVIEEVARIVSGASLAYALLPYSYPISGTAVKQYALYKAVETIRDVIEDAFLSVAPWGDALSEVREHLYKRVMERLKEVKRLDKLLERIKEMEKAFKHRLVKLNKSSHSSAGSS